MVTLIFSFIQLREDLGVNIVATPLGIVIKLKSNPLVS